jgi:putative copper export protein
MSVDILSVTLRAFAFVALFQAGGIVVFLALQESEPRAAGPSLRRLGILSALLAAILLITQYLLEAARMSGELAGILDPTLQRLLIGSTASVALSWQLLGLLLIAVSLMRRGARGTAVGVIGVVILLAPFTFVGHTSTSSRRWLLGPVLLAHLSVVTFWFGALLPLYLISLREPAEMSARTVARFSRLATWLVPGLFVAGITLAAGLLPNLAALGRPYGALLITKVAGFCVLMLFAALNKWRFGPALRSGERAAGQRFRYALAAEYGLIVAILGVTAVMTTFYSPES